MTAKYNNKNFLQKLTINPTLEQNTNINTVIDSFKKQNLITEKTANSLKLENPKTPYISFFINNEILGDLLLTQTILTQVIHLSLETITYKHMYKTYHRTPDFIKKVRDKREDTKDRILVSMNVKERLIFLSDKPIATKVIIKFLFLILILKNSFSTV